MLLPLLPTKGSNINFLTFTGDLEMTSLPKSPRGNPLLLCDHDADIQQWIRRVRLSGGVINNRIVMAGAEAIITKLAKHKLEKYGGHVKITKSFAISLLKRMGFVKRKGAKAVKSLSSDFESIRENFVKKVENAVKEHNVPDNLIINWDQTGCQLAPGGGGGGELTVDCRGSEQVTISGLDDKRQVTLLLSVTKSGVLLPPQIIY